jgi:phospholipase/carboxylesterase
MNRIQFRSSSNSADEQASSLYQARIMCREERGSRHAIFVPMHYERNYAYPLLIWLHGPRDDERQLQRIMPLVSLRNYVAIAPRSTHAGRSSEERNVCWTQDEAGIVRAEQAVYACVEQAQARFHVDPRRIFLAGLQDGGTMALRIGLRAPHRFAGLLTIGGPFPRGNSPLLHLDEVRRLPLFIANGRDAALYPVDTACDELRLFHAAGLNVTLRQYPCGDELTTRMLHDMDGWIMEQVTGQSAASQEPAPPRDEIN